MLANHTAGVSLYLLFSLRKMAICGIINIIYFWNTQYTNIYIRRMSLYHWQILQEGLNQTIRVIWFKVGFAAEIRLSFSENRSAITTRNSMRKFFKSYWKMFERRSIHWLQRGWIETVNAIGLESKRGKNYDTMAHPFIACDFEMWNNMQFRYEVLKYFMS